MSTTGTRPVCITCGQVLREETEPEVIPPSSAKGRGVHYGQDIADRICSLIVQGLSLAAICAMDDMPDTDTVVQWRRRFPSFAVAYAQAREDSADALADEILAIADQGKEDWVLDTETNTWKPDHDVVNRAKLRVDARKWIASKLKPSTYSDRVEARLTGEVKHSHAHAVVSIDATQMSADERQLLRAALLPRLSAPPEDEDGGQ